MLKMKSLLFITLIIIPLSTLWGENDIISDLNSVQQLYSNGKIEEAFHLITEIREELESILLASSSNEYEVVNWDKVKMLPDDFIGSKVSVHAKFLNINSNGSIYAVTTRDTYEETLIDTILSLEKYQEYNFYGTVMKGGIMGPLLHIERIESITKRSN